MTTIEELLTIAHNPDLAPEDRIRKVLCKLDFHDNTVQGGLLDQLMACNLKQWHEGYDAGKRTMKSIGVES